MYINIHEGYAASRGLQVGKLTGGERIRTRDLQLQTQRPYIFWHRRPIDHLNLNTELMVTEKVSFANLLERVGEILAAGKVIRIVLL